MPIYEYVCKKCHHKFEKIQKFSDAKIKKCPECGGPVQQALTAPAVHFKGTGWYVTDYAKKSEGKDASGSDGKEKAPAANEKTDAAAKESSTKESSAKSSGDDQKSKKPHGKKKD